MADRTVTARLRTTYDKTGTDAAAKGIRGVGDQAKRTSQNVGRDWGSIGKSVAGLGDSLTTKVSLPLIGLGALATKAAADFDSAFVQMQTLAGVSADEVDGLKESVLGLAGDTGKAPQELADAMFFLSSSGLDAAGAMEALEVSAKASAAGLGDTVVLADAASSVMLAYAESGITAAEAMDTLIATAKAGKAEPAAIAGQLSKLIPVAAALDISFQDVGGALAALSTKSFSAEQGATGLAAVMSKLQKPSQQAQEALDEVGLSGNRLQELLAEKGLLGTLQVLKERLGDNGFVRFLEDQEAIRAGTALLGGDLKKTEQIFEDVADSAGSTEKAFETWAESMGAKNARAFADFQVALIRLGEVIAPIASDIMAFLADVVSGFAKLPEPVQRAAIAFAAILAISAPLASAAGRVMKAWDFVTKVWDNFSRSGGRAFADAVNAGTEATNNLSTGVGGVGKVAKVAAGAAGVGALLLTLKELGDAATQARVADLVEDFMATKDAAESVTPAIEGNKFAYGDMAKVFDTLLEQNPELAQQYLDQAEALGLSKDMVESAQAAIDRKTDAEVNATAAAQEHQAEVEGSVEALADEEQAVNEAAEAYKAYADQIRAAVDPVFGLLNSLRQNDQAQRDVRESLAKLNEVRADSESTAADITAAEVAYQDALINVGTTAADVTSAAANLNAAVAENPALLDQALGALQTWREQGLIPTDEQLQFLQRQIQNTALEGVALGDVDPRVDVSERGSKRTRDQMHSVRESVADIPKYPKVYVSVSGALTAVGALDRVAKAVNDLPSTKNIGVHVSVGGGGGLILHEGGIVPGSRGQEIAAVLQAGEEVVTADDPRHSFNLAKYDQPMVSAAALGGGMNVTNVVIDMGRGVFVGSKREFREAVTEALNVKMRKGRGLNAA